MGYYIAVMSWASWCWEALQQAERCEEAPGSRVYEQWKMPYTSSCTRHNQCGKRLCLTPGVLEDQHSLPLLLSCPMIKCPWATTNAETQWLKCHKSVCLDKRARLDSLERLSNLESNDPTISRHTSVKASCRVK